MNRVRNLIGHQRIGAQGIGDQQLSQGNIDNDDQQTVCERQNEDISDSITLNTIASESSTIGDFQRQGYVNRCPSFNAERTMPFAYVLLTKGFFCFPSEISFKRFLDNKRKFDVLDRDEGLGIPLFHAISGGVVKTIFNRHAPIMRIYKYLLIDSETEKPPVDGELISQDGSIMLFKYLFCCVYQEMMFTYSRVEHRFIFHAANSDEKAPETATMANYVQRRDTDTKLLGLNLRWYGTTGFASPFGTGSFRLLVLDDGMASRMDQSRLEEYEEYARNHRGRSSGRLPIWATYSDECSTMIPKKRTIRLADFKIGETNRAHGLCSTGLMDVPLETQTLACMCMVLHDFESRKDKRSGGVPLLPSVFSPVAI